MKECLVVNQKVGASNPRARPLLSPSANLTYRHQAASTAPSFCSPRSPSRTVLRNRCSALNCVRHHSFTPRAVEFVGQSPSGRQSRSYSAVARIEMPSTATRSRNRTGLESTISQKPRIRFTGGIPSTLRWPTRTPLLLIRPCYSLTPH